MSLIRCPECGHEVSTTATACPNCAYSFVTNPTAPRNVVVTAPPTEERGLPNWAFAVFGLIGVLLLLGVFIFMKQSRNEQSDNSNINVSVAGKRKDGDTRDTPRPPTQTVTVPAATDSQPVSIPSTTNPASVTTVPASSSKTTIPATAPDKGTVIIDAKITNAKGTVQTVKAEKFYLLDESLDSILSKADIEPIDGQSLTNSFGLSVLYPARYVEFNRDALNAIKSHIKYNVLTDANGKAQLKDVKPNSYYLFGVTKSGNAFAVWDSPITIQAGENILSLSPQKLTEVENNTEEDE
jgi:hypothetical protein